MSANRRAALDSLRPVTPQLAKQAQQAIYAQLRNAILRARFRPGELISLRSLAAAFGVSPMPVRDAASRLIAEGCLESVNRIGLRIPTLTPVKAREIVALRLELEGLAAQKAARSRTDEELTEIENLETKLLAAVRKGDLKQIVSVNTDFHLAVYRAAHDDTLFEFIELLLLRYAPTLMESLERMPRDAALASWFDATHGSLIEALRRRDGKRARSALVADIQNAADQYWGASSPR